ncbi:hypothetical protein [Cerasicoccus fimbriatus]|uniref:hypothetical protein n=1 Tax=Cerasicoccus fimbriatus TaxID=3014554 RepID=UPI0022B342DB|nr:hypothetical protein [Cerasicoccus sp. TK19100]
MKSKQRADLHKCLDRYLNGRESVFGLQQCALDAINNGLDQELSGPERRKFYKEYFNYIDPYLPELKPRGGIGILMDKLDLWFNGIHRLNESDVQNSAKRLITWL